MKTSNEIGRKQGQRHRRSGLIAWLATACALLATIGHAHSQSAKGIEVTVSVFSGRPDPHFQIVESAPLDQLRSLLKRASASAKPEGDSAMPSILGYRGVVIENAGQVAGLPSRVVAFNGVIELGADKRAFVVDEARALEKYLVELALKQGAIDEKLYRKISARW
jgi:hypothetical protein